MPKWVDRAMKLTGATRRAFVEQTLLESTAEAATVAGDLQFVMQSQGATPENEVGFDDESLCAVERFYRSSAQDAKSFDFGVENLERMLSLYLGQTLVERGIGEWAQYDGKNHVFSPIVVRLVDGRFVDVFLFCSDLHRSSVVGHTSGIALQRFVERVDKLAFA